MDFHLGEDLVALQDLARQILDDHTGPERLRRVETSESRIDVELWGQFGQAGLLAAILPEESGGAGLGLAGLGALLQEQGRHVAALPLWSAGLAALTLAAYGDERQRELIAAFGAGSGRMTLALEEFDGVIPAAPECRARRDGACWRLEGRKAVVPSPSGCSHVLVSAATEDGPGLFLVEAESDRLEWEPVHTTTHDRAGNLELGDAPASAIGEPGGPVLGWLLDRAGVAVSALTLGVAQGALQLAARYTSERYQFGRPLGTFQSLAHQLADCYIDIEAMSVTLWQAVSALEGADGPPGTVQVARWWAARAGLDVVHRVQHVHGGMGVDVDYPVHRYFLWGKQLSGTLTGPGATLEELGTILSQEQVCS